MPITFRNVNAPSNTAANQLITQGTSGIQSAFRNLGNLAQKVNREQISDDTNKFKDLLAATDLSNIGQVDTSELGRLSQSQAENLINTRRTNLRNTETASFNFGETQRKQREQPLIARANELARSGDVTGLNEFITSGEGQGIQDTSALSQTATNQSRANTQFARTEDTFQDQQSLNRLTRQLQGNREIAVAARKIANQKFEDDYNRSISIDGSQERGVKAFTVNGSGTGLDFNESLNMTDAEKSIATNRFEEFQLNQGDITSDTQQRKKLTDLVRKIGATPQQEKAALGLLSSNQAEQRKLTDQSKAAYAAGAQQADTVQLAQLNEENNAYQQFVAENPIDRNVTAQMQKIKVGDVLADVRSLLPGVDSDIDKTDVVEVTDAITAAVDLGYGDTRQEYPGWVVQEAFKTVGAEGLINDNWYSFTESAKIDTFKVQLDRIMARHLQSEDNREKVRIRTDLNDTRKADFGILNLQNKAKALSVVRNSQRQIQIRN